MSEDDPEIRSIPVDLITVLNPRVRNKRIFQELVDSIAHLGLKKPITVSKRPGRTRYDLVCGQGRLEAFIALGQTEIPALVVIRAYQRETERQKLLVKRASLARSRLLFVANAMRRLLTDEHFVALLRAEGLSTLPRPLAERVGPEALP